MKEQAAHTSRGPERKVRIFEPSRVFDTPLIMPLKNPRFLCRSRPRFPKLLKAASNVVVADERALDYPEDPTHIGQRLKSAYTHTDARTAGPLVINPGA